MAWIVGIDEAGYGPNLGPFVMSMVTVRVPDWATAADTDLWDLLGDAVCRAGQAREGRLVLDDSKRVYSPARGLGALERSLLHFTWHTRPLTLPSPPVGGEGRVRGCPLRRYWKTFSLTPFRNLRAEPWYLEGVDLPLCGPYEDGREARLRLEQACQEAGVHFNELWSVVVFPRQFNALVERRGSKAAVPCWALKRLLRRLTSPPCPPLRSGEGGWEVRLAGEETRIYVDKLGGRNRYQPFLQSVFRDRLVMCRCESAGNSAYHAPGPISDFSIAFQPEADRRFLPVALASMLSKYLREVLMTMFNRFWQEHVPGLKPTAGYPGDAARFYADIEPARKRLGIPDQILWRSR